MGMFRSRDETSSRIAAFGAGRPKKTSPKPKPKKKKNPYAMMKAWQVCYGPKGYENHAMNLIYVDPTGLNGILDIKELVVQSQDIDPKFVYSIEELDQAITPNSFRMFEVKES